MRFAYIIVLGLLLAEQAKADDLHLVDIDRLTFEAKRLTDDRDPFFPGKTNWFDKYDLYWNVRIMKYFFWNNDIEGLTDYSQFVETGWHFTQGLYLGTPAFAAVHEHYSRHSLDTTPSVQRFPVQDSYGLQINFINK